MSKCKCERDRLAEAYNAIVMQNYGRAAAILGRLLGYDKRDD